ncbi:FeoA family protein [Clostridium kluyveri]|uniref:Ferrous iron transport protein A n=1 Tax=Clostridium kluyveri TaxID=1534 RepID=A0A1L5F686_CLOKL|nr:FeoA family protein [Clostridium kluyveri]APM38340.1 ferrous iron transport protein A [Clostridium kluyveri]UZQ50623.1 ferrous iron transport protein A [Clostridium kluyveri]
MLKLNNVPTGNYVTIDNLLSTGMLRERMLALGLTKGTTIEVVRKGPSGDPTVYNIRGAMIALRNEESSLILVDLKKNLYKNSLSSEIKTNII